MATDNSKTVNAQIAEYSRETHDDYLADYDDLHERIAEYPSLIVYADQYGNEYNEWSDAIGVTRQAVSNWMHFQAQDVNHSWTAADPVVLLRD